jgi:hypothetical protein
VKELPLWFKRNVNILSQVTGARLEVFWLCWAKVEQYVTMAKIQGGFVTISSHGIMNISTTTKDQIKKMFWDRAEIQTASSLPYSKNLLLWSIFFFLSRTVERFLN